MLVDFVMSEIIAILLKTPSACIVVFLCIEVKYMDLLKNKPMRFFVIFPKLRFLVHNKEMGPVQCKFSNFHSDCSNLKKTKKKRSPNSVILNTKCKVLIAEKRPLFGPFF